MELAHWLVTALWFGACATVTIGGGLTVIQQVIQNYYSALPILSPKRRRLEHTPLVSVHVPAYNEPPNLLRNTIRSLSKQTYRNYDLRVLDNNTRDPKIWKPVAAYCRTLGKRVQFTHIEHLPGYKAAALNLLRDQTGKETEYIATIDSDYETSPAFLSQALQYFADPQVGFVQFPQAYFNDTPRNLGILLEYEYFFATYMTAANRYGSVNATGTLTVFRRDVLKKIGFYNTASITEDADMGYRMIAAGYHGVYVHQVMGRGLIPYDVADYKRQKLRWAKGNSVILGNFFRKELFDPRLTWQQKVSLFSQLTAWLTFTLPAIVCILAYTALLGSAQQYVTNEPWALAALGISVFTLLFYIVMQATAYLLRYAGQQSLWKIGRAYLVHLSMHWVYATAAWRTLYHPRLRFIRTNKFITPILPSIIRETRVELGLMIISGLMGLMAWQLGLPWLALTNWLITLLFSLIYYFMWEMSSTKTVSAHLMLTRLK